MLWANILEYVKPVPGDKKDARTWLEVDPDIIYPAVIAHLKDIKKVGSRPHPGCLDRYYLEAGFLPPTALDLALVPYGRLTDIQERLAHDQALELARAWFTAALRYAIDGPIGINILNRPKWRLYYV